MRREPLAGLSPKEESSAASAFRSGIPWAAIPNAFKAVLFGFQSPRLFIPAEELDWGKCGDWREGERVWGFHPAPSSPHCHMQARIRLWGRPHHTIRATVIPPLFETILRKVCLLIYVTCQQYQVSPRKCTVLQCG